jgi:hypothetical protein
VTNMTAAEIVGLVIGSVGTVAAIVAAWASVAERLESRAEKRAERKALNLQPVEESILFIASQARGEQIRVGAYTGGLGLLVAPSVKGIGFVINSDEPIKRLEVSGYLVAGKRGQMMAHGPVRPIPMDGVTFVSFYRLTIQGRKRALTIPPESALAHIQSSGVKGNF